MKKITLFAAAAMVMMSGSAFAQSEFDGVYAGASGGYGIGVIELGGGGVDSLIGSRGLDGQAYVGYGTSFDAFYVGIEGAVGYSGIVHESSAGGTTINGNARESYGVYGRLGFSPAENNLLYGIAGLGYTNWEFTDGSNTDKYDVISYRLGVGTQQVVTENVFARLSVDFDIAKDPIQFAGGGDFLPVNQTARVGLGFRF